jgi:cysteine desulfurase
MREDHALANDEHIYLDYAATTPVDPAVAAAMAGCLTAEGAFANPASTHGPGRAARAKVEAARAAIGAAVGVPADWVVLTSGATESNNLALKGFMRAHRKRGKHLVTCKTEHKSVLDTAKALERDGCEATYLVPDRTGRIDPAAVAAALRDDTVLVALMLVNNELGVVQPIAEIATLVHARGALLHVDAVQGLGKLPLDMRALGADSMSLSAHKCYGPKGIGALVVRRAPGVVLEAQIHGGGHERGLRSGTLATHQIVGFGLAAQLAAERVGAESARLAALRARLEQRLAAVPGLQVNCPAAHSVPNIVSISVSGVHGESLLADLDGFALSTGSACSAASPEPSYVLRALGLDDITAAATLRVSMGRGTTERDVDRLAAALAATVARLRDLAPAA